MALWEDRHEFCLNALAFIFNLLTIYVYREYPPDLLSCLFLLIKAIVNKMVNPIVINKTKSVS